MESWAKWTARTVLVTTGLATASCGITGVAFAGTGGTNTGNVSVLGENQVNAPVSIPADVCGNAAAILGIATAGCQGGASVAAAHTDAADTAGSSGPQDANISIGHGNTVKVPVIVAADACGNSIGNAPAKCHGGIHLPASSTWQSSSNDGTIKQSGLTAGNLSVGDSNDVQVPVTAPIDACGNAAAVLGDSSAGCEGGATIGGLGPQPKHVVNGGPLKKVTHPSAKKIARRPAKKVAKKITQAAALSGPVETLPAASGLTSGLPVFSALHGLTGQNGLTGLASAPGLTKGADLNAVSGRTKASGLTKTAGLTTAPGRTGARGLTRHSTLMPASTLTAAQRGISMSNNSFASLAIGALLAGAAALKLASRRPSSGKARSGQVSA